ncbi:glutaredoxin family protein [Pistricoccus aurantiacus]|uniref:Glutaredoxin family protein n=1 Tax=Pistricoccus aurantiacus TaxID=1883414 RepID=A0A5B8SX02_9GAMM|nr:glutaredoxin family protein [Pistricoccus aurantiacus]QEA39453.1 glutaredoxin family protein [Pistricoccus aurantiacus]
MMLLRLYTTLGCHLCEQLEARLMPFLNENVRLERIEIAEDDRLVARYGERIPVLQDEAGAEFAQGADGKALAEWLAQRGLAVATDDATLRAAPRSAPSLKRGGRRVLG